MRPCGSHVYMAMVKVLAPQPQQCLEHLFGAPTFAQNHGDVEPLDPDIETLRTQRFELVHSDPCSNDSAIAFEFHNLFHFPAAAGGGAVFLIVWDARRA